MNCPRCQRPLDEKKYRGLEVDRCPACRGLWLDFPELEELESTAAKSEALIGTRDYSRRDSELRCPHCGGPMETFNYRAYDLPIDHCVIGHGYWLDPGEEERVLELIKKRSRDLRRSGNAEESWARFMERGGSRSFLDKVRDLFS